MPLNRVACRGEEYPHTHEGQSVMKRLCVLAVAPGLVLLVIFSSSILDTRIFYLGDGEGTLEGEAVAVCFFGLTRSLRNYTLPSLEKYLLGRLREQNVTIDVFLHTYALSFLDNPRSGERHARLDTEEWRLLHPLRYEIEDVASVDLTLGFEQYMAFGNAWDGPGANATLMNLVRQLHSIRRCWDLVEQHMNETSIRYRYVIFARPDVRYVEPGLPDLEQFDLADPGMRRLGISMEDRFAVGSPDVIKIWATRGDEAWDFMAGGKRNRPLHSETLVRYIVEKHGLTAVAVPICFQRVRANGASVERDLDECRSDRWLESPWHWAAPL